MYDLCMLRLLPSLTGLLLVALPVASAGPVTWAIQNVTLNQGTLTGSFIYDADLGANGTFSNWSLTIPSLPSYGISAETLTPANSIVPSGFNSHTMEFEDPVTKNYVALYFFDPLTDAGGTDVMVANQGFIANFTTATPQDFITSGIAQAVPEPGTLGLMMAAIMLGGVSRSLRVFQIRGNASH